MYTKVTYVLCLFLALPLLTSASSPVELAARGSPSGSSCSASCPKNGKDDHVYTNTYHDGNKIICEYYSGRKKEYSICGYNKNTGAFKQEVSTGSGCPDTCDRDCGKNKRTVSPLDMAVRSYPKQQWARREERMMSSLKRSHEEV